MCGAYWVLVVVLAVSEESRLLTMTCDMCWMLPEFVVIGADTAAPLQNGGSTPASTSYVCSGAA